MVEISIKTPCIQVRWTINLGDRSSNLSLSLTSYGQSSMFKELLRSRAKFPQSKCTWAVGPGKRHIGQERFPAEIAKSNNGEHLTKRTTLCNKLTSKTHYSPHCVTLLPLASFLSFTLDFALISHFAPRVRGAKLTSRYFAKLETLACTGTSKLTLETFAYELTYIPHLPGSWTGT